jgi:hypothetical protein
MPGVAGLLELSAENQGDHPKWGNPEKWEQPPKMGQRDEMGS